MDLMFPPSARVSGASWQLVSNSAASRSIFTGAVRSVGRQGDRWRVSFNTANAGRDGETYNSRAALQALRAQLGGQANRIWLLDPGYRPRGSFPATELLTNPTFANGTTGWSMSSSGSITAADRVLRWTKAGGLGASLSPSANPLAFTQYAPYVWTYMQLQVLGTLGGTESRVGTSIGGTTYFQSGSHATAGMITDSFVLSAASAYVAISAPNTSGVSDILEIPYTSLSRCALVDNGPNLLLQSDEFDATWAVTRASVDDQAGAAPDGTTTADSFIEDSTAANTHLIGQSATVSSAAADYCFSISLKAGTRAWAQIRMAEATGSGVVYAYINLTTGALGSSNAGANWANLRTFVRNEGNGWYRIYLVARKTNAATSITAQVNLATGDEANSYSGNGTGNILLWRASLAASSLPVRGALTTSAATSGTSQTGSALYIKGLPASTNGLLLEGDRFQIGSQLCKVTAALNSDAAGIGYLQFAPALRASPADNAPVIIHQPMGRFVLTEPDGGWSDRPGLFSDFEFQFEEALDA